MSAVGRTRWPWLIAAAIVVIGGVVYSRVHAQNAAAPARNRQTTGALPVVGARAEVSDVGVYLTGLPKQQLDTQVALVQQLESTLKSDAAQIASAKLNLTYAHIESPATGRIGLRLVDPGNIVHATDQNGLAVITQRQPIAVVFTIAQDRLPDVLKPLHAGKSLPVDAYDREIKTRLGTGQLIVGGSQIDPTTGTIRLKATFPNDPETLFPNQFVNARLRIDTLAHAIVIPTAAVQRGPQNTFVYVVSANGTVQSRTITVAFDENDHSVVTKGLAADEIVVTDGADRLQPGSHVSVKVAEPESPHARCCSSCFRPAAVRR